MKKLLLASTALVGFAGAAAAEGGITLSGYAEIGIFGGDLVDSQFHNDFHINFNFSGTTDNGVEFGGKVQIEENNTPALINGNGISSPGPRIDDEAFWVSGSFGKVTLGETDGAIDWAVPDIFTGTAILDDHSTHAGAYWNTGMDGFYDNQIMRYEYSFGDFGVALSAEMDDNVSCSGNGGTTSTTGGATTFVSPGIPGCFVINPYANMDPIWGIGGKWSGDMSGTTVSVGIGYQSNGDASTWSIAGKAAMANGFSAALGYASFDDGTAIGFTDYVGNGVSVDDWWGLGLAYATGPITVGVNYGVYGSTVAGTDDPSGWGLVANYDLGGGAVAMFGYGSSSGSATPGVAGADYGSGNGAGQDTWSIGLGMSF